MPLESVDSGPMGPPLFRRAKTPWSIRIHIEFDPFIHLPFSCCSWRPVRVPLHRTLHPILQSLPPCDELSTASPNPITIIPPASVSRPGSSPTPHLHTRRWYYCLIWFIPPRRPTSLPPSVSLPALSRPVVRAVVRCGDCAVLCCAVLSCPALPCPGTDRHIPSNCVGPQSYCRQLPFPV